MSGFMGGIEKGFSKSHKHHHFVDRGHVFMAILGPKPR